MSAPEIIEGEAVEVIEPRAVAVVQQPGQAIVNAASDPKGMVQVAAVLASALKDIVERQKLYAVIQGKKYPQVEAWMTVARMDNVVAREVSGRIIRHDDGAYEAEVELIRLSDGMVIGRGSALCGSAGDNPWDKRPEPARRSMAVTRATSRAFRQQYSWIMALAGYEPTPAEEMPRDEPPQNAPAAPRQGAPSPAGAAALEVTVAGTVKRGDGNGMDLLIRQTPNGAAVGFKLIDLENHPEGRKSMGVRAFAENADALAPHLDTLPGQRVVATGILRPETIDRPDGGSINYKVLVLDILHAPDFTIPPDPASETTAPVSGPPVSSADLQELDALPW